MQPSTLECGGVIKKIRVHPAKSRCEVKEMAVIVLKVNADVWSRNLAFKLVQHWRNLRKAVALTTANAISLVELHCELGT